MELGKLTRLHRMQHHIWHCGVLFGLHFPQIQSGGLQKDWQGRGTLGRSRSCCRVVHVLLAKCSCIHTLMRVVLGVSGAGRQRARGAGEAVLMA